MEKVYLALEMVGLTAEKAKLENDFREGVHDLKSLEVRVSHTTHTFLYICLAGASFLPITSSFGITAVY